MSKEECLLLYSIHQPKILDFPQTPVNNSFIGVS